MKTAKKMKFRRDINGLRAFAVLAVLIYHFLPTSLPGGFAGVDVFFVISGFLMTGIIYRGVEAENFSLKNFYIARVKRIVPVLLVLLFVLFLFGFFFLPPSYNEELCNYISSSIIFISNIILWNESGYFTPDSQQNWLLHTWSLAVEFQFYIIYPIIYIFLNKLGGNKGLRWGVVLGTVVGFILSIFYSRVDQSAAFYLFPFRAWEMLLGGVVCLYPIVLKDKQSIYLELFGFLMIMGAFFFYSSNLLWPSYYALLPASGTCLVLWASRSESILTSNAIAQRMGSASYSIYLWHWPVFVFLIFFNYKSEITVAIGMAVSIVLGFISYYLVEVKVKENQKNRLILILSFACLVLGLGSWFIGSSWIISPVKYDSRYSYSPTEYHQKYYGGRGFRVNKAIEMGGGDNKFIIAGDSFALQYARELDSRGKNSNFSVIGLFHHGCIILPDFTKFKAGIEDKLCSSEYAKLKKVLENNPELPLVIAHSWKNYANKLGIKGGDQPPPRTVDKYYEVISQQVEKIIEDGGEQRKYYLVAGPQYTPFNTIDRLTKESLIFGKVCPKTMPRRTLAASTHLKKIASIYPNVFFIDPNEVLCTDDDCLIVDVAGNAIRSDKGHLSVFGTKPVVDLILSAVL